MNSPFPSTSGQDRQLAPAKFNTKRWLGFGGRGLFKGIDAFGWLISYNPALSDCRVIINNLVSGDDAA